MSIYANGLRAQHHISEKTTFRIRLSRGHLRRGIHSQSRALLFGSRPQLRSLFTGCLVLDVSINQDRVFLSPRAHARAPWLQALSSPSPLLRGPPTPTSSSHRVIALRHDFAALPIARVGLPSS
jgi:hypothetical protein